MRVRAEGPQLISEMVRKNLNIDCSVLMGANIAKVNTAVQTKTFLLGFHASSLSAPCWLSFTTTSALSILQNMEHRCLVHVQDIGKEELSEATIGYAVPANGELFKRLFETPYFYVQLVPDIAGAEMAGTFKNVVALAAGFVDGLQKGPNTKVCPNAPSLMQADPRSDTHKACQCLD